MGVARVETKKEINVLDSEFKSPLAVQTSIRWIIGDAIPADIAFTGIVVQVLNHAHGYKEFSVPSVPLWPNPLVLTRDHPDAPATPLHATCPTRTAQQLHIVRVRFPYFRDEKISFPSRYPKRLGATHRKFALLTDAPQMDMLKYGRVII